jgi:hypothetical protein
MITYFQPFNKIKNIHILSLPNFTQKSFSNSSRDMSPKSKNKITKPNVLQNKMFLHLLIGAQGRINTLINLVFYVYVPNISMSP